jgi:hypothetical protein
VTYPDWMLIVRTQYEQEPEAPSRTWANQIIRFCRDRRQPGTLPGFDEGASPLAKRRLVGEGA